MNDKKRVLLVVPPYYAHIYGNSVVRSVTSRSYMVLSLGALASPLREKGHEVRILDLNIYDHPEERLIEVVKEFKPDIAGISSTSPIFRLAAKYSKMLKELSPGILTVVGGVHPTIFPKEPLEQSDFDMAVFGEGEDTLLEIVQGNAPETIKGVAFRKNGAVTVNPQRGAFLDLDRMPMPALDLYEIQKYRHPRAVAKRSPVTSLETSRGCFGQCVFCNMRNTKFRFKSTERIIREIEYALSLGYREVHFLDDNFTANRKRAADICKTIIDKKMDFTWQPRGGLRVDTVDEEIFRLMKRAGAWTVPFGIESGNQAISDRNKKGIKLEQVSKAVSAARKAGLRTEGYFMLGLLGETEQTVKDTIAFAKSLDLDLAKFAVTIPLPGTPMFDELDRMGMIKTKDWSKYTFSTPPSEIYTHPTVDVGILDHYYEEAHREFYFRPKQMARLAMNSIKTGQLFDDIKTFFRTKWF